MSKKPPNLVFLVLDTVGAKHLSLYGYHRPTTPNLEKIARESTVYTRCFAPSSWTVFGNSNKGTSGSGSISPVLKGSVMRSPRIKICDNNDNVGKIFSKFTVTQKMVIVCFIEFDIASHLKAGIFFPYNACKSPPQVYRHSYKLLIHIFWRGVPNEIFPDQ